MCKIQTLSLIFILLYSCSIELEKEIDSSLFLPHLKENFSTISEEDVFVSESNNNLFITIKNISPYQLYRYEYWEIRAAAIRCYDNLELKNDDYEKINIKLIVDPDESTDLKIDEIEIEFEAADLEDKRLEIDYPEPLELLDLLGEQRENEKVLKLNAIFGSPKSYQFSTEYFKHGLSLGVLSDTIQSISFIKRGQKGYNEYKGKLPYDLSFNDDLEKIEEKLGTGNISEVNSNFIFYEEKYLFLQIENNKLVQIFLSKNFDE